MQITRDNQIVNPKIDPRTIRAVENITPDKDRDYMKNADSKEQWRFLNVKFFESITEYNQQVSQLIDIGFTEKALKIIFNVAYKDYSEEIQKVLPDINLQTMGLGGGSGGGGALPVVTPEQIANLFDRLFGTQSGGDARALNAYMTQIRTGINRITLDLEGVRELQTNLISTDRWERTLEGFLQRLAENEILQMGPLGTNQRITSTNYNSWLTPTNYVNILNALIEIYGEDGIRNDFLVYRDMVRWIRNGSKKSGTSKSRTNFENGVKIIYERMLNDGQINRFAELTQIPITNLKILNDYKDFQLLFQNISKSEKIKLLTLIINALVNDSVFNAWIVNITMEENKKYDRIDMIIDYLYNQLKTDNGAFKTEIILRIIKDWLNSNGLLNTMRGINIVEPKEERKTPPIEDIMIESARINLTNILQEFSIVPNTPEFNKIYSQLINIFEYVNRITQSLPSSSTDRPLNERIWNSIQIFLSNLTKTLKESSPSESFISMLPYIRDYLLSGSFFDDVTPILIDYLKNRKTKITNEMNIIVEKIKNMAKNIITSSMPNLREDVEYKEISTRSISEEEYKTEGKEEKEYVLPDVYNLDLNHNIPNTPPVIEMLGGGSSIDLNVLKRTNLKLLNDLLETLMEKQKLDYIENNYVKKYIMNILENDNNITNSVLDFDYWLSFISQIVEENLNKYEISFIELSKKEEDKFRKIWVNSHRKKPEQRNVMNLESIGQIVDVPVPIPRDIRNRFSSILQFGRNNLPSNVSRSIQSMREYFRGRPNLKKAFLRDFREWRIKNGLPVNLTGSTYIRVSTQSGGYLTYPTLMSVRSAYISSRRTELHNYESWTAVLRNLEIRYGVRYKMPVRRYIPPDENDEEIERTPIVDIDEPEEIYEDIELKEEIPPENPDDPDEPYIMEVDEEARYKGFTLSDWIALLIILVAAGYSIIKASYVIKAVEKAEKENDDKNKKPDPEKPDEPDEPDDPYELDNNLKYMLLNVDEILESVGLGTVINTYNELVTKFNNSNLSPIDRLKLSKMIKELWSKISKAVNSQELKEVIQARQNYDNLREKFEIAKNSGLDMGSTMMMYSELSEAGRILDVKTENYLKLQNKIFDESKGLLDADVTIDDKDTRINIKSNKSIGMSKTNKSIKGRLLSKGVIERIERKRQNRGNFSQGLIDENNRFNNYSVVTPHEYPLGLGLNNSLVKHNKREEILRYSNTYENPKPYNVLSYNQCVEKSKQMKPKFNNVIMIDNTFDDSTYTPIRGDVKFYNPYQVSNNINNEFNKNPLYNPEYILEKVNKNRKAKDMITGCDAIRGGIYRGINNNQYYQQGNIAYKNENTLNNYPLTMRQKKEVIKPEKHLNSSLIKTKRRLPNSYSLK